MDIPIGERNIMEWDEADVHIWLSSLGYPQYESQIREHKISGDILCVLDSEGLKAVGISTIGQRLAILKAVYLVKLAHNVPIDSDHYVPPSEVTERVENVSVDSLYTMIKEQATRIQTLEDDNRNLNTSLHTLLEEFNHIRTSLTRSDEPSPLHRQPSFKWAQFVKPQTSPTKLDHAVESPHPSPQQLEHDIPPLGRNPGPGPSQLGSTSTSNPIAPPSSEKQRPPPVPIVEPQGSSSPAPKPHRQESSENLNKSFKVTLDDPTWKVLPAALKKYRINNDNWQNYAMFICYGSAGNRIERCLSYDEKPLLLFQKLKDAKKNPVFMLKHIKDIRSPIAVAQQKHAARKASSVMTNESTTTSATVGHAKTPSTSSRTIHRPPRLEVQDLSTPTPLASSLSPQPGWPEPGILSPAVDSNSKGEELALPPGSAGTPGPHLSVSTNMSGTTLAAASPGHDHSRTKNDIGEQPPSASTSARDVSVASTEVSYAVAIYPYMAEQEDEFDVVVGDTFVILSRARGWWVVQRDPTGSGIVETDIVKQGWVPAGCLLETKVPVASAIAEATAAKGSSTSGSPPHTPISKTPILPLSIISTSFPGIALMDYKKKGDEELDLAKDDALRVFKRYNHWSYAVKEEGGDRGWVPSWFIGKVPQPGNAPPTPSSGVPSHLHNPSDDTNQAQVSPMSSAFPSMQTR
ncbi:Protein STE50 [Hypsizygus marmoreus]|uniref:Protein STE50 n=1 Tax=Hypsizygus marmoreus TaxID=39966 RepID=A0A369JSL7_HYPMA|nr:Protein STE50 [Hypsizygus marmoreus]